MKISEKLHAGGMTFQNTEWSHKKHEMVKNSVCMKVKNSASPERINRHLATGRGQAWGERDGLGGRNGSMKRLLGLIL